ncbi:hypothetical protein E2493_11815 [Sphingomonas parva]|uniref:DUF2268 domain-containing protein n=1 Tax=Sphingomonas parva TaxID=2555898 RepID=A0A4Y8ZPZ7_9SPHN|nr:hypothetical protein [Sphingomonas parva]TFI58081.1 hypothetical protein E2493_11815 [Sphingomonas parva]
MGRIASLLLVVAALCACTATDRRPETAEGARASTPLAFVDLVDDFAAFQAQSEGQADAARLEAFKAYFATRLPGFYSGRSPFPGYDAAILSALKSWPEQRTAIEAVRDRFAAALVPAQHSFEAEFGPMTDYPPILLVHSAGEFDGGTRDLPGGSRLMFGADVIARIHGDRDIRPFFHHELFHLLHGRTFSDCDALWCGLWNEGLATYVAHRLNPAASDDQLLLTQPVPLRPAVEKDRRAALCPIVAQLDSTSDEDIRPLFMGRASGGPLPPRYGYYVGYLVAAEIGKDRPLKTLAAMPANEVRPLIEASLRRLGGCQA